MMFWEVLITALRGLVGGMIAGALLSQLVFLIIFVHASHSVRPSV